LTWDKTSITEDTYWRRWVIGTGGTIWPPGKHESPIGDIVVRVVRTSELEARVVLRLTPKVGIGMRSLMGIPDTFEIGIAGGTEHEEQMEAVLELAREAAMHLARLFATMRKISKRDLPPERTRPLSDHAKRVDVAIAELQRIIGELDGIEVAPHTRHRLLVARSAVVTTDLGTNICRTPACRKQLVPRFFFCRAHWRKLPKEIRNAAFNIRADRPLSDKNREVVDRAVEFLRQTTPIWHVWPADSPAEKREIRAEDPSAAARELALQDDYGISVGKYVTPVEICVQHKEGEVRRIDVVVRAELVAASETLHFEDGPPHRRREKKSGG